ncbi:hypothetical protein BU14_0445s0007 [Porphyra umbilicalis]|uniref:Uncharacterized protein n=1 Tax=Porphyra umbilicalis TaxID=2786 RepID=A0A1X6NUU0_PORUM|nr:hypothetical protein BU14_0445s0007 [Porphyra umbilicalis]|eukprot:OSX72325.1 hypothetical protein BU14_0445s0007 [Porphyra umbilicalis]
MATRAPSAPLAGHRRVATALGGTPSARGAAATLRRSGARPTTVERRRATCPLRPAAAAAAAAVVRAGASGGAGGRASRARRRWPAPTARCALAGGRRRGVPPPCV